ncbi:MAG: TonB-dependent receptor [Terracidiphilus sp.]|nr:TonB-dependent receptor [Terracidiphilus sp.]MDR3799544.1 TonB-dependent receptor [Terracidiphilus sp.]
MRRLPLIPIAQILLLAAVFPAALAQDAPTPPKAPIKGPAETMVVLGAATPVPLTESQRSVEILRVQGQSLAAESPQDFLRQDSSIFLEERGGGGGQADIVMRGGSFEQTLVLLNGFRINDAQTSHHNLDLPVPLDAIDSIQSLEGAGSTLHGVDALSGVVDFLTAAPDHDSLFVRAGQGSFQSNEETLIGGATRGPWSGRLAAERNFSTGFMTDRDYRNMDASAESWNATRLGITDLLFAASDRSFGANQFYGNYPSWERTKGWFAAARQELGSHTVAAFGYRRHSDEFVLFRNDPAIYENNHIDGSWQGSLRQTLTVHKDSVLLIGLEADGDSIRSNNLGLHARNRGAGYVDLDLRPAKQRWSLSVGAREEIFSGGAQAAFSPELAGSLRVAKSLKLRASGGYGFRIPTYTDLYYSDPSTLGNANLKPESAWSSDAGADWAPSTKLTLSATGFYSQQHHTIDYIKSATVPNPHLPAGCPANTWCAANLNGLGFSGVETRLTWIPKKSQTVRIAWTGIHGAQSALHGLESEYVFNYPVQNIHASWNSAMGHDFVLTNAIEIAQRYRQTVYPVWNATLTHDTGKLRPYLRLTNLSNTGYQEITGVNMPPRTIMGGVALQLGR